MKAPERLFSSDPDLARIVAMLDRDGPPEGASKRAAERVFAADVTRAPADRPRSLKLWVVLGLGSLTLVVAGIASMVRSQQASVNVARASSAPPLSPPSAESTARVTQPETTMRVEDLPIAPPRPVAPSAHAIGETSPSPATDSFSDELALVEQARSAIAKGRGRECLEAVTTYEKRFAKSGLFREEVEVMRIEALAMNGDRADARARGTRFLASHRDTPYAERIRRVLEQSGE